MAVQRDDLLRRLTDLETELHRIETRRDAQRLEQLLHPEFVEFGCSGRRFSRADVISEFAAAGAASPPVHAERFELAMLATGCALLTYTSSHRSPEGERRRRTLRSSLWVESGRGWQMRFHQGTPADET